MDKLEERLRSKCKDRLRPPKKLWELMNPDGPEAADEITRLNAEVERLQHKQIATDAQSETNRREADDHAEAANRWRNEWGEAQALIDEMVEGLEGAKFKLGRYRSDHPDTYIGGVAAEYDATIRSIEAHILKARGKDSNVG